MLLKGFFVRTTYSIALLGGVFATVALVFLLESKIHIFSSSETVTESPDSNPFPVSVNAFTQIISEDPRIDEFYVDTLANRPDSSSNWWNQVAAVLATKSWYQNLASPVSRIIVIWPGERKEETTKNIGDVLAWDTEQKKEFQSLIDSSSPIMLEGKYFPGQYVTHKHATPADIHQLVYESFSKEILARYTDDVELAVPLENALIIASLLEREASDFDNMREISGVIWNRIFIDMPLQLDATLQYVKGSAVSESRWWPVVKSSDKYLVSPFNTYKNKGLPPAPISNPSAEAVVAAINPVVTDCLFYFHTSDSRYHCSTSYEDHVAKLKAIYGRGS
jgi:cell division protein YceG involved in septum cleavage